MPSVLPRIIASIARQAIEAFDLASELDHPGESGRAREAALRRFLEKIVPPDFGIDTGFVIDAAGGVSRQVDVVIYRRQRAPVLEIGGVSHFMVESVAAVIEVKAAINSRKVLTAALDNIASVKSLDRSNGGDNRIAGLSVPVDVMVFQNQVWGGVVAGKSMKYPTCLGAIADWMASESRTHWPNAYADIHGFLIDYATGISGDAAPTSRTSNPMEGQGLFGSMPWNHPWGLEPPLAMFATELLNFLRVAPLIDFSPFGYFSGGELRHGYFSGLTRPMPKYFRFPDGFGTPSADDERADGT